MAVDLVVVVVVGGPTSQLDEIEPLTTRALPQRPLVLAARTGDALVVTTTVVRVGDHSSHLARVRRRARRHRPTNTA